MLSRSVELFRNSYVLPSYWLTEDTLPTGLKRILALMVYDFFTQCSFATVMLSERCVHSVGSESPQRQAIC